ncbi:Lipopolysaccharide biosynthesis protein WzxC [Pseudoruegeria aquimaris]|uniref:Lipopolysaccharide biosynthesis protein WzxC n=1 Tax=Pseudoruegeria aquimaris TaxID=393663 RepID=A0A1Y5TTI5_9RHOB|nr:oligosaccharide flippase family protein [Pseudoruegeria aquimaris]SLN67929.1 Lipopolysaccharide biosynthesis protein WzxC [Pseudoruegeria aquimaris]
MRPTHLPAKTFAANLMAYGASEVAAKLSRLFVVFAVARALSPEQIGTAAAALAVAEIVKAMTETGVVQRVIAAEADALESTCKAARRIVWGWCLGLFALQLAVAAGFWAAGLPMVGGLLAVAALEYLFMPGGIVQAALAMRDGKMKQMAAISGAQIVGANAAAVALALAFPSPLALILPRVLSAPLWLIAVRRLRPWAPVAGITAAPIRPFATFGAPILGTEMVKALRLHADKLLVGALLGADALGYYFMAFNAGLSLATSFTAALGTVLFPQLCAAGKGASLQAAGIALAMIAPVVIAQALLAPLYVPALLGADWALIAPTVSVLCLSALPLTLWTVCAAQLRAENRPQVELWITLALTVALAASTVATAPFGLTAMAWGYLATCCLILGLAAFRILTPFAAQAPRTIQSEA